MNYCKTPLIQVIVRIWSKQVVQIRTRFVRHISYGTHETNTIFIWSRFDGQWSYISGQSDYDFWDTLHVFKKYLMDRWILSYRCNLKIRNENEQNSLVSFFFSSSARAFRWSIVELSRNAFKKFFPSSLILYRERTTYFYSRNHLIALEHCTEKKSFAWLLIFAHWESY